MALTLFSPSTCCILIWSESESKSLSLHSIYVKNFVLMFWYVLHCGRKCVLVSTCLCGPSWHSRASVGSQVCRCQPVSMASLWSLSLYIVKVFLSFSSVCLEPNNIEVWSFCGGCPIVNVIFFFFCYNLVGPDCAGAVLRKWASGLAGWGDSSLSSCLGDVELCNARSLGHLLLGLCRIWLLFFVS